MYIYNESISLSKLLFCIVLSSETCSSGYQRILRNKTKLVELHRIRVFCLLCTNGKNCKPECRCRSPKRGDIGRWDWAYGIYEYACINMYNYISVYLLFTKVVPHHVSIKNFVRNKFLKPGATHSTEYWILKTKKYNLYCKII